MAQCKTPPITEQGFTLLMWVTIVGCSTSIILPMAMPGKVSRFPHRGLRLLLNKVL